MMNNYDDLIREIIIQWKKIPSHKFAFQKAALERHIIPKLYYHIRKDILKEIPDAARGVFSRKFNRISMLSGHLFWILLWTIKWVLIFRNEGNKFIIVALGSDRELAFSYIRNTVAYASETKASVISLNVICKREFLFNKGVFYFPRFLYKYMHKREIAELSLCWSRLVDDLSIECENKFKIKIDLSNAKRFVQDYSVDFYTVDRLVSKLKLQIMFLLQDFDYTSNKNIYCEIFKNKDIPTISLNHSILIYSHLYESVYSDYLLVWGKQQIERIKLLSTHQPKMAVAIGNPLNCSTNILSGDSRYLWVYYLPSFENPAAETIFRSTQYSLEYINEIKKNIVERNLKVKLIIKSHPNDSVKSLKKLGMSACNNLKRNEHYIHLAFVEDTTKVIELLRLNIPIIYISDKMKRDPYNFKYWRTAEFVESLECLKCAVNKIERDGVNVQNRGEHFEYFWGEGNDFYSKFSRELNQIKGTGIKNN